MSRQPLPLPVEDISAFSRALSTQLRQADGIPSHLALMNMLARAAGFRNFQHLRAAQVAGAAPTPERPGTERPAAPPVDARRIDRAVRHFDGDGRLLRWPSRRALQELCLWALWSRMPAGETLSEREMNDHLNAWHDFGDPALLRRDLVEMGHFRRNRDGSDYRRIERPPPAEAHALIRALSAR